MLEIKANGATVEIKAKGTLSDLINEYGRVTNSLMHEFLMPYNTDAEYERIAVKMVTALGLAIKRAINIRKKEVSRGSTE